MWYIFRFDMLLEGELMLRKELRNIKMLCAWYVVLWWNQHPSTLFLKYNKKESGKQ